jgi:FkbM family methyltransferase
MEIATLNLDLGNTKRTFLYRKGTSDMGAIVQVLKNGDYNFGRLQRAGDLSTHYERLHEAGKRPLIIDAGANIGAASVYFGYSFPKAQIVAIEPERSNFDLLAANTAGLSVECIHGALGPEAGTVNVVDTGRGHWGFQVSAGQPSQAAADAVECVTINDIYARYGDTVAPFIAKIDIEGSEAELFASNTGWVARTPVIIIELHDWMLPGTANSRSFLECVGRQNRDFVYIGENIFSIDNTLVPRLAAA